MLAIAHVLEKCRNDARICTTEGLSVERRHVAKVHQIRRRGDSLEAFQKMDGTFMPQQQKYTRHKIFHRLLLSHVHMSCWDVSSSSARICVLLCSCQVQGKEV